MPKIKILVVSVLIALAATVTLTGCSLFSSDSDSDSSEALTTAKTVAKKVLQIVCTAYNSGGNTLAETKIASLVEDGTLTEAQAIALKSILASGVSSLEAIANSDDSSTTTTESTASGSAKTGTTATETK